MTAEIAIITPVITLVLWSMVMWVWMYITRLPAVKAAKIKLDPNAPNGEQMAGLPAHVRWKADNYNHLMEQPTVFYAISISLAILGAGDGTNLLLAWCYVGFRVLHSFVQALSNKIELRFICFALSNIPLFGLSINALLIVLAQ